VVTGQRVLAAGEPLGQVPVRAQGADDRVRDAVVVLDDQDLHVRPLS
jgi:hypothetical protein